MTMRAVIVEYVVYLPLENVVKPTHIITRMLRHLLPEGISSSQQLM